MTFTITKKTLIEYSITTLKRAKRALRCSPFQLKLFTTMIKESVPLAEIASKSGHEQGYTYKEISETTAENQLMWLIKVGILRREVDGQGITDSFRLTPLGRFIISEWENQDIAMNKTFTTFSGLKKTISLRNMVSSRYSYNVYSQASFFDYLLNTLSRLFSWQF